MKMNKQLANILFYLLLAASLFITWMAVGMAGDRAFSGEQPIVWINVAAFILSIGLVALATLIKTKYGK